MSKLLQNVSVHNIGSFIVGGGREIHVRVVGELPRYEGKAVASVWCESTSILLIAKKSRHRCARILARWIGLSFITGPHGLYEWMGHGLVSAPMANTPYGPRALKFQKHPQRSDTNIIVRDNGDFVDTLRAAASAVLKEWESHVSSLNDGEEFAPEQE